MTTEFRIEAIGELCDQAGCNQKMRKVHYGQYVHRQWNPHPSERFLAWWKNHKNGDIKPTTAYNTRIYMEEYLEAKNYGAA